MRRKFQHQRLVHTDTQRGLTHKLQLCIHDQRPAEQSHRCRILQNDQHLTGRRRILRMRELPFQHPDWLNTRQNRRRIETGQEHAQGKNQQQHPPQRGRHPHGKSQVTPGQAVKSRHQRLHQPDSQDKGNPVRYQRFEQELRHDLPAARPRSPSNADLFGPFHRAGNRHIDIIDPGNAQDRQRRTYQHQHGRTVPLRLRLIRLLRIQVDIAQVGQFDCPGLILQRLFRLVFLRHRREGFFHLFLQGGRLQEDV